MIWSSLKYFTFVYLVKIQMLIIFRGTISVVLNSFTKISMFFSLTIVGNSSGPVNLLTSLLYFDCLQMYFLIYGHKIVPYYTLSTLLVFALSSLQYFYFCRATCVRFDFLAYFCFCSNWRCVGHLKKVFANTWVGFWQNSIRRFPLPLCTPSPYGLTVEPQFPLPIFA